MIYQPVTKVYIQKALHCKVCRPFLKPKKTIQKTNAASAGKRVRGLKCAI